jgi:hypothetical protein
MFFRISVSDNGNSLVKVGLPSLSTVYLRLLVASKDVLIPEILTLKVIGLFPSLVICTILGLGNE